MITAQQKQFALDFIQAYADDSAIVRPNKPKVEHPEQDYDEQNTPTDFERSIKSLHNELMGLVGLAPTNHARECVLSAARDLADALEVVVTA